MTDRWPPQVHVAAPRLSVRELDDVTAATKACGACEIVFRDGFSMVATLSRHGGTRWQVRPPTVEMERIRAAWEEGDGRQD